MRREANFGNHVAEILRKSRREERETMWWMWEREKGISAMILPKNFFFFELPKLEDLKKKKKKLIFARVILRPKTILPYFYKLLLWPISYLFSSRPTNNITFLFTNNHSSYQQFMKVFVKKFVYLAFCQKWMIKKKKKLNCGNWIAKIEGVKKETLIM